MAELEFGPDMPLEELPVSGVTIGETIDRLGRRWPL